MKLNKDLFHSHQLQGLIGLVKNLQESEPFLTCSAADIRQTPKHKDTGLENEDTARGSLE